MLSRQAEERSPEGSCEGWSSMKIALCAVQVPFIRGGAEYLCDSLYNEMVKRNYEIEYIRIPFKWYPPQEIISHSLIWKLLDLSESNGSKIDGVITTKFPSYLVTHQNHVIWLFHQHRSAYDNAYTQYDDLTPFDKTGEIVRKKIQDMDSKSLKSARNVYTISQNVANRLLKYNNIRGTTLYPPPPSMGKYYCKNYEDYILYPSRLDSTKRQDLIIKSMKYIKSQVRLKIVGTGPESAKYQKLASELNLQDRIDFCGKVSDTELLDLYANASCILYTPYNEDLGFITMESFFSKKPVITCSDSGGSLEFVDDAINGFVVDPDPVKIAEKIDLLVKNGLSRQMGEQGYKKIHRMNLSWDTVIQKLVEPMK
jgi:glycosyltransferase involved in cell wall biosynthesis